MMHHVASCRSVSRTLKERIFPGYVYSKILNYVWSWLDTSQGSRLKAQVSKPTKCNGSNFCLPHCFRPDQWGSNDSLRNDFTFFLNSVLSFFRPKVWVIVLTAPASIREPLSGIMVWKEPQAKFAWHPEIEHKCIVYGHPHPFLYATNSLFESCPSYYCYCH